MRRRVRGARTPALLMVVHGPYPPDPRVEREVRVARDLGYEVDVVALSEAGQPSVERLDGTSVFRLPVEHSRTSSLARSVVEYLGFTLRATTKVARLDRRRQYSVVHVHNPPDFLMLAALLPKLRGARVIFDVHDLASDMFAMRFGSSFGVRAVERVLVAIERAAAAVADVVVTVHEPYKGELTVRGVPAKKIEVVMNSLDDRIAVATVAERREDRFSVVYHGSITPHYGVELLVEAAALVRPHVPGLVVHVFGTGDALGHARRLAAELAVDDVVEFSGRYLPHGEVLASVARASLGVVPNLPIRLNRFALSSKLLEYVALEVPAVCADLPTLRAHFTPDEVTFFKAGDADALADAIVRIARDPAEARRRSENALRRYNDEYAWPRSAARYAAILRRWRPG